YIAGVECGEDEESSQVIASAVKGEMQTEEVVALIEKLIAADTETDKVSREKLSRCEKRLESLTAALTEAENNEKLRAQLINLKVQLAEGEQRLAAAKTALESRSQDGAKIQNLLQKTAALKAELPLYEQLQTKQIQAEKFAKEYEERLKTAQSHLSAAQQKRQRVAQLEEEREKLKLSETDGLKAEGDYKTLAVKAEELKRLIDQTDKLAADYKGVQTAKEEYEAARKNAEELRNKFTELNRIFLDAQAGVLAQTLQEGSPCPVCGSVHHPSPATPPKDVPSAAELDKIKAVYDDAALVESAASVKAGKAKAAYDALKDKVRQDAAKYISLDGVNT
ncbi:MAG: hypothetical protein K2O67_06735, partial [Clostridia bacterium]|nr:hypothetical protein [Clostridia bacterium]